MSNFLPVSTLAHADQKQSRHLPLDIKKIALELLGVSLPNHFRSRFVLFNQPENMLIIAVRPAFPKVIAATPKVVVYKVFSGKIAHPDRKCGVVTTDCEATKDEATTVYRERLQSMMSRLQSTNINSNSSSNPFHEVHSQMYEIASILLSRLNNPANDLVEVRITKMERDAVLLDKKISMLYQKEAFLLYQACTQSLAYQYHLKLNISDAHQRHLRGVWNCKSLLFDQDDSKEMRDYKTKKALTMLQKMDEGCQKKFRFLYSETFVNDVIHQFKDYEFSEPLTDQRKINFADSYWRLVENIV